MAGRLDQISLSVSIRRSWCRQGSRKRFLYSVPREEQWWPPCLRDVGVKDSFWYLARLSYNVLGPHVLASALKYRLGSCSLPQSFTWFGSNRTRMPVKVLLKMATIHVIERVGSGSPLVLSLVFLFSGTWFFGLFSSDRRVLAGVGDNMKQ